MCEINYDDDDFIKTSSYRERLDVKQHKNAPFIWISGVKE